MNNQESTNFNNALAAQDFNEHERNVIYAILQAEGKFAQEDIIDYSPGKVRMLKKLGWYKTLVSLKII